MMMKPYNWEVIHLYRYKTSLSGFASFEVEDDWNLRSQNSATWTDTQPPSASLFLSQIINIINYINTICIAAYTVKQIF